MRYSNAYAIAALGGMANAVIDSRRFFVMHFKGDPIVEERIDPIISPGTTAAHVHTVQGGSSFSSNVTAEEMLNSKCTNTVILDDYSNYWVAAPYFQDPVTGLLEKVPLFCTNAYYLYVPMFPSSCCIPQYTDWLLPITGSGEIMPA